VRRTGCACRVQHTLPRPQGVRTGPSTVTGRRDEPLFLQHPHFAAVNIYELIRPLSVHWGSWKGLRVVGPRGTFAPGLAPTLCTHIAIMPVIGDFEKIITRACAIGRPLLAGQPFVVFFSSACPPLEPLVFGHARSLVFALRPSSGPAPAAVMRRVPRHLLLR
jgi:hypothetical protein